MRIAFGECFLALLHGWIGYLTFMLQHSVCPNPSAARLNDFTLTHFTKQINIQEAAKTHGRVGDTDKV